jgi:hypothetical protein
MTVNLQRVPHHPGHGVSQRLLTTACCNKMQPIGTVVANLDGNFGEYWCEECARASGHKMPDEMVQLYPPQS